MSMVPDQPGWLRVERPMASALMTGVPTRNCTSRKLLEVFQKVLRGPQSSCNSAADQCRQRDGAKARVLERFKRGEQGSSGKPGSLK